MVITILIAIGLLIMTVIWQFPLYKESSRHSYIFLIIYVVITAIPAFFLNMSDKGLVKSLLRALPIILTAAVLIIQLSYIVNMMTKNSDIIDNMSINSKISDGDKNMFSTYSWLTIIFILLQLWGYSKILLINLKNNLQHDGRKHILELLKKSPIIGGLLYEDENPSRWNNNIKKSVIWQRIRTVSFLIGATVSSVMIHQMYYFLNVYCTDDCRLH